ncbi:MAG: hypothetical protein JWN30_477, partial [Bacilli bacterium]|nr:hypothetical protein [Bacilli bacterium]
MILTAVSAILLSGCGPTKNASQTSPDQLVTKDPVTITIGMT